eukprot:COSAG06_NODE_17981_length_910_cov_1.119605_1_plen_203_part_10
MRWVAPPDPHRGETTTGSGVQDEDSAGSPPPLVLQAAIGSELHFVDVSAFIAAFERRSSDETEAQRLVRLCGAVPDERMGAVLGGTKASAETIRTVLEHVEPDALAAAAELHPWLRVFAPDAKMIVTADTEAADVKDSAAAEEEDDARSLRTAIEAAADVSVVSLLLDRWQSDDAAPTIVDADGHSSRAHQAMAGQTAGTPSP